MVESLKLGDLVADPGKKIGGYWKAIERLDGLPENVPVLLVNGSKPGPTLWLSACQHGDEVSGTIAVQNVFNELNPERMRGSVIGVPISNPSAFRARARCSPHDKLDLNRVYPGDPNGSYTQRLAHALFSEISSKANYLLDIHGGGDCIIIDFCVFDYWVPNIGMICRELAEATDYDYAFGIPEPILGGGRLGQKAVEHKIPQMTIESPRWEVHVRNILNVMAHLRMTDQEPIKKEKIRINKLVILKSKHGGIFLPKVDIYDKIKDGQVLGTVVNLLGEEIEKIVSPIDGMVMTRRVTPTLESTWAKGIVGSSWGKAVVFELAGLGTKEDW